MCSRQQERKRWKHECSRKDWWENCESFHSQAPAWRSASRIPELLLKDVCLSFPLLLSSAQRRSRCLNPMRQQIETNACQFIIGAVVACEEIAAGEGTFHCKLCFIWSWRRRTRQTRLWFGLDLRCGSGQMWETNWIIERRRRQTFSPWMSGDWGWRNPVRLSRETWSQDLVRTDFLSEQTQTHTHSLTLNTHTPAHQHTHCSHFQGSFWVRRKVNGEIYRGSEA